MALAHLVALVILALGGYDLQNSLSLTLFSCLVKTWTVSDDVIIIDPAARTVDGLVRKVNISACLIALQWFLKSNTFPSSTILVLRQHWLHFSRFLHFLGMLRFFSSVVSLPVHLTGAVH